MPFGEQFFRLRFEQFLFVLVYAQVLKPQLFAVHHVVERAEHLQDAVERHGDDAPHARNKIADLFLRHVAEEAERLERLIVVLDLHGRADDDGSFPVPDNAVILKFGCDVVSDMRGDGKDILLICGHGIAGKIDDGMIVSFFPVFKDAHGDARKAPDDVAKIGIVDFLHKNPPMIKRL